MAVRESADMNYAVKCGDEPRTAATLYDDDVRIGDGQALHRDGIRIAHCVTMSECPTSSEQNLGRRLDAHEGLVRSAKILATFCPAVSSIELRMY